jgi:hypothetical protein
MGIDYKPYREHKVISTGYTACIFHVHLGYFGQTLDQIAKRGPVTLLKTQIRLNSKFKLDILLEDDFIPVINSAPTA